MSRALEVLSAHPGVTVQDRGRPGLLSAGVSRGGAADPLALDEAEALLGQQGLAALEMAGHGATLRMTGGEAVIALTGAPMRATAGGRPLAWPGTHRLVDGETLEIGPVRAGSYGYLAVDGDLDLPCELGARSAHIAAGLGRALAEGDRLPLGAPQGAEAGRTLDPEDRFGGGLLRLLPSAQTAAFSAEQVARLEAETATKSSRANRQGVALDLDGPGLALEGGLSVTSEAIVPGDIQIVGEGAPYILLGECQTTGGYPRIATVISADLPRVAQAPTGATFRFRFVSLEEALAARRASGQAAQALGAAVRPLVRDPAEIPDLLSYQLIDGVTSARHH
jgi:allophanate hydrolase